MAPEIACHEPYNVSADTYSWAMVCFEILTLEKPYERFSREMHDALVCRQGVRPEWPPMSREYWYLQDIITSAWNQVPHRRPSMATLCYQLTQEQNRCFMWFHTAGSGGLPIDNSLYRKVPTRNISDSTDITVMSAESGIHSAF